MAQDLYLAVGSLNRTTPYFQNAHGVGLAIFAFDTKRLEARKLAETGDIDNPTFLSVNPATNCIYANSEVFGWHEGTVSAYRFDRAAASLSYLNKQSALGSITAHNTISADSKHLLLANYSAGRGGPDRSLAAFPILADGSLAPACGSVAHQGAGTDPERQERSHAHCIVQTPDRQYYLSADLGIDKLLLYRLSEDGQFLPISSLSMPEGAGPRHVAQHRDGKLLFVANELNSTVATVTRDGETLTLTDMQPAVPAGIESHLADIHVSPDGRFVYASNRGHDSIAIFTVNAEKAALCLVGHVPTGGKTPRNFALSPDGRLVFVANQNSDNIVVFTRDSETGLLTDTGKHIEIGTPMCVRPFL
ncbi:MAG: lactonase family protein [Phyllobacterium sp.]